MNATERPTFFVPEPGALVLLALGLGWVACWRRSARWAALLLLLVSLPARAGGPPFSTNGDPAQQIRFWTAAEADAKRAELIAFIWGASSLPTSLPAVEIGIEDPPEFGVPAQPYPWTIDPTKYARLDWLQAWVANWDYYQNTVLIHPVVVNAYTPELVIVHMGHVSWQSGTTGGNFERLVHTLLDAGFTVAFHQMPGGAWDSPPWGDTTGDVPGYQGPIDWSALGHSTGAGYHDVLITDTGPANGGWGFRPFLEDIVQTTNYWLSIGGTAVHLTGYSGGGWTTQMSAAVDPRIRLSVPVAGSYPLYVRNVLPGSEGDEEQHYPVLYDENIAPDWSGGGVATWLEVYALGGYGAGRRQIQVNNDENCCFGGTWPDGYKGIVAQKVADLGAGTWEHAYDPSNIHQMNDHTIDTILMPALVEAACSGRPDADGDGICDAADNCPNTPNPGQEDLDGDGAGDACDPDADGDGFAGSDCDDLDPTVNPGADEICDDSVDNECDGKVDCSDKKECNRDPVCSDRGGDPGPDGDPEICDDGIDNDGDGKVDCQDKKDCNKDPAC